MITFLIVNRSY